MPNACFVLGRVESEPELRREEDQRRFVTFKLNRPALVNCCKLDDFEEILPVPEPCPDRRNHQNKRRNHLRLRLNY